MKLVYDQIINRLTYTQNKTKFSNDKYNTVKIKFEIHSPLSIV